MDGLMQSAQTYWDKYSNIALENIIVFAPKLLLALFVIWAGSTLAGRLNKTLLKRTTESEKIDTTLGSVTASLVKYAVLLGTLLVAVSILGVEIAKIFTIFAAMTLAVGLALQGTMSNVAAGILLMVFHPYKVGDYVEVNDVEGIVDDVNIFTTVLRTLDNVKLTLANGDAWRSTIKNFTSQEFRRVDVDFGIDYDDDMDKAIKIIKDTAAKHEHVLKKPDGPWAKIANLGDSSVDIQMRVWCKPEHYWDVMFDLTKSVKEAFDKGGISIPYPHGVEIMKK